MMTPVKGWGDQTSYLLGSLPRETYTAVDNIDSQLRGFDGALSRDERMPYGTLRWTRVYDNLSLRGALC